MPEKPEVLTVVKSLKPRIVGKTIRDCNVYWENIIAYPTTMEFKKEGLVLGLAAKMFVIAGPVLVYGITASAVVGVIYWFITVL